MADEKKKDDEKKGIVVEPDEASRILLPNETIDRSQIYDVHGNKLRYGNDDPNVLGPDDNIPLVKQNYAAIRDRSLYSPLLPNELFAAEATYVLPFANFVAEEIVNVNLIDELTYRKLQVQLKQRSIFCVLDISDATVVDRRVTWKGLRLICKEFEVASVTFCLDLASRVCLTRSVRLWLSAREQYTNLGDPSGLVDLGINKAATIIENYLQAERILK